MEKNLYCLRVIRVRDSCCIIATISCSPHKGDKVDCLMERKSNGNIGGNCLVSEIMCRLRS